MEDNHIILNLKEILSKINIGNILSMETLEEAYYDCLQNKRTTANAQEFQKFELSHLITLHDDIINMKYEIGRSIAFCVTEPVLREIFAADFRDRIIHHLIVLYLLPMFESEFIFDAYSCRNGKGTSLGVDKVQDYLNQAMEEYNGEGLIIKCDLKSFFMTIDKELLYNRISRMIDEHIERKTAIVPLMKYLIALVIFNCPQNNCIKKGDLSLWNKLPSDKSLFNRPLSQGIAIGNLTSQLFANMFLSDFDHFVKEELKIKYYGRYVDDFYFIVPKGTDTDLLLNKVKEKLEPLKVILHPKKVKIHQLKYGFTFLGNVIKPKGVYTLKKTVGKLKQRMELVNNQITLINEKYHREPTYDELMSFIQRINTYLGFMLGNETFNLRKKILLNPKYSRIFNYMHVNDTLEKVELFKEYVTTKKKYKYLTKEEYIQLNTDENGIVKFKYETNYTKEEAEAKLRMRRKHRDNNREKKINKMNDKIKYLEEKNYPKKKR